MNQIDRMYPQSPDPIIEKQLLIDNQTGRLTPLYRLAKAPVMFAHLNELIDNINAYISTEGYQGTLACNAVHCPVALKDQYWFFTGNSAQFATDGPIVEAGDKLICIADNATAGDWSVVGTNFMIVEKNIAPTTEAQLITGTGVGTFYNPAVFTAHGIAFGATTNMALTHTEDATDNLWTNLNLSKSITGTLDGAGATLNNTNIYCTTTINADNTATEEASMGYNSGFGYYENSYTFASTGISTPVYGPSVFDFVLSSNISGAAGTLLESYVWGIGFTYNLNGTDDYTALHLDSWSYKSTLNANARTANSIAGDWTNYYSVIQGSHGVDDPLVSVYGFRAETKNVMDAALASNFYSSIEVHDTSIAHNEHFTALFTGTRDTAYTDNALLVTFGDPITPVTYTLNNAGAQAYGLRIAAQTAGFVQTDGQLYGIHMNATAAITPSATCERYAAYFAGNYTYGISFKDAVLAQEANTGGTDGSRNHAFFSVGTWTQNAATAHAVGTVSDHYAPIQVNIQSSNAAAFNVTGARFRVDTAAANTNTALYALQMRNQIAHNVGSAYTCHASMNLGTLAVQLGSVAVGSFYLEGTGAVTPAGTNPIDVVNITNVHSGTGISNGLNVCHNSASSLDFTTGGSVIVASALQGTVREMLYLNNAGATCTHAINTAGTITNLINVAAAASVTSLITVDAIGGFFITNALVPAAAPDAGTMGADACIRVYIGATPYYIPLYDTLHA